MPSKTFEEQFSEGLRRIYNDLLEEQERKFSQTKNA